MSYLPAKSELLAEKPQHSSWTFNPEATIRDYCREHPIEHFKVFSAWSIPGWGKQQLRPKTEKKIRGSFGIPAPELVFLAFDADLSLLGPSKFGFALCSSGIYAANISYARYKKVPELAYTRWDDVDFDAYTFDLEEVDTIVEDPTPKDYYRLDPDGEWVHIFGNDYLVDSVYLREWLLGLNEALKHDIA